MVLWSRSIELELQEHRSVVPHCTRWSSAQAGQCSQFSAAGWQKECDVWDAWVAARVFKRLPGDAGA